MIAIDLNKQQALDPDPKARQQSHRKSTSNSKCKCKYNNVFYY